MTRLKYKCFPGLLARLCVLCAILLLGACASAPATLSPADTLAKPAADSQRVHIPRLPSPRPGDRLQQIPRSASQYILAAHDLQASYGAAFDGEYLTLGDPLLDSFAVFAATLDAEAQPPSVLQLSGAASGLWLAWADWGHSAWSWETQARSFDSTATAALPVDGLLSAGRELRFALFCPAGSSARIKLDLNMEAPQDAPWNLLLWMAADNNLSPYGVMDLNELESVGSTGKVRILAGYDIPYDFEAGTSGIEQVNFIKVAADADPAAVNNTADPANVTFERSGYDCGDPRHLREFVQWASDNFPAEHTALVLWGHGTGWRPERDAPPADKGGSSAIRSNSGVLIDYSDGIGGHTSNGWIAAELEGFHFDLLLFDSCSMGDVESLFEYRELADYMVASSVIVPIWGFPYDAVMSQWASAPGTLSAPEVGHVFMDAFLAEYDDREICHALIDSAALTELGGELQFLGLSLGLANKDLASEFRDVVEAQPLLGEQQDLGAFLDDYLATVNDPVLRSQAEQVRAAYENTVRYFVSENAPGRSGLYMFLPGPGYTSSYSAMYRPLAFNQYTQWLESLEAVGFE